MCQSRLRDEGIRGIYSYSRVYIDTMTIYIFLTLRADNSSLSTLCKPRQRSRASKGGPACDPNSVKETKATLKDRAQPCLQQVERSLVQYDMQMIGVAMTAVYMRRRRRRRREIRLYYVRFQTRPCYVADISGRSGRTYTLAIHLI
jgi:hypothetical protein